MRKPTRELAALLVALLAVLVPAGPAAAHGQLAESDPADGAAVAAPLEQLTMWFTELPGREATFVVTAPDGTQVQGAWRPGEPRPLREPVQELDLVDGTWTPVTYDVGYAAVVPLAALPAAGVYRVAYDSVASDGEQVTGTTTFTYRGAPTPASSDVAVSPGGAVAADAVFPALPPPAPSPAAVQPRALGPTPTTAAAAAQDESGPSVAVLVALAVLAVVAANVVVLVRRRAVEPESRHTSARAGARSGRSGPARRQAAARTRTAPVSPRSGGARSRRR